MVTFYAFGHLWHNITGELLRFADRRFYDAWWESVSVFASQCAFEQQLKLVMNRIQVSLQEFYRKGNPLVQDWLYAYVYVPVYNYTANRSVATYSVVFLSGVAHEFILVISFRFFFPFLFVLFAICGRK